VKKRDGRTAKVPAVQRQEGTASLLQRAEGGRNPRTDLKVGHYKGKNGPPPSYGGRAGGGHYKSRESSEGGTRLQKSPWMEEPMREKGQKENREKDRHQDL
jgi:hypothetical protein